MRDTSFVPKLKRYSAHAISRALDEDFAVAVHDVIELVDDLVSDLEIAMSQIEAKDKELKSAKSELCLHCGRYKKAYLGQCDGCRWREQ